MQSLVTRKHMIKVKDLHTIIMGNIGDWQVSEIEKLKGNDDDKIILTFQCKTSKYEINNLYNRKMYKEGIMPYSLRRLG